MLIGTIGLSLALLHGIEAALWAEAYLLLGALDTPAEAMLFSIDSMTTRGASGLTLHQHWQEMSALEGVAGVLCSVSAPRTCFSLCNFTCQRYMRSDGTEAFMGTLTAKRPAPVPLGPG